jgi:hypothetical protein
LDFYNKMKWFFAAKLSISTGNGRAWWWVLRELY